VPIILGRPMLATTHARIDVYRKKISLEVGNEKVPNDFEPQNLEEFLMNDDLNRDLGNFLQENYLLQNVNLEAFSISDNGVGISLDDFDFIEDL
ncbi:hypothetical protein Tco_1479176, partial [Tanacetum coccineum]